MQIFSRSSVKDTDNHGRCTTLFDTKEQLAEHHLKEHGLQETELLDD
jgi:hypothetical protein